MPTGWEQLRNQWEYAHATNFGFGLAGFIALAISILVDVPQTKNLSNNLGERSCFLCRRLIYEGCLMLADLVAFRLVIQNNNSTQMMSL